ncbi:MAG: preprotein translocase subunit SecA [Oscillospiraceae bacterium]|nr:preprotein translocase subunit SecA [Oscillospiraceae bacterium]
MFNKTFAKLFGTHSDREIRKITPLVEKIMALDEPYQKLTDEELRAKTDEFRARYASGETLDDLLPEAFATVREAAWRVIGEKFYRVQIIGGIVLHQGRIAEMKTGEGKTEVATMPAYLNAIAGNGVHIVTVNDYLAKVGADMMGKVYRFLGMTVGTILHDLNNAQRRAAYACDITYGTNNELGFDYLRDNMAIYKEDMVQRGHAFVIVDEVDSILIDEARTPLIISGQGEESSELYRLADDFAARARCLRVKEIDAKQEQDDIEADYIVDEKARTAVLTPQGVARAERAFNVENLMDPENTTLVHHINQAIKARGVMQRDIDYVVKDGQVIIVDEFTGRLMYGRRYNEGLHQAIEAKEHVEVARESKTLATITFQNYFRLYNKLSGMTGTALTEEEEFRQIYDLDVIEIPTNKPVIRIDHPDVVYRTKAAKYRAVLDLVQACHAKGQPVMVGTVSIEVSEHISRLLKQKGIEHNVLNAKYHDREAEIVAQAGRFGAVTIATNMAGRGTDIKLGGNADFMARRELVRREIPDDVIAEAVGYAETDDEEILAARAQYKELCEQFNVGIREDAKKVIEAGGLYIIGTERHEARRIDNQLRGRSGRQGDPGESTFIISMEDDILRLFGSERLQGMMEAMKIDEDMPIDAKILSNAIENAQKRVESRNFEVRKNVLEYDDVLNMQRGIIYKQRAQVLDGEDLQPQIQKMLEKEITAAVASAFGEHGSMQRGEFEAMRARFAGFEVAPEVFAEMEDHFASITQEEFLEKLMASAHERYKAKEQELTPPIMREAERVVLLRNVDMKWMDHIDAMTELRQDVRLRAYAQHDPVLEYKKDGYEMFEAMVDSIAEDTVRGLYMLRLRTKEEPKRVAVAKPTIAGQGDGTIKRKPVNRASRKIGRNDPCPCGSGKKYKNCCMLKDQMQNG